MYDTNIWREAWSIICESINENLQHRSKTFQQRMLDDLFILLKFHYHRYNIMQHYCKNCKNQQHIVDNSIDSWRSKSQQYLQPKINVLLQQVKNVYCITSTIGSDVQMLVIL